MWMPMTNWGELKGITAGIQQFNPPNKQPLLIFGWSDCRTEGCLFFLGCLKRGIAYFFGGVYVSNELTTPSLSPFRGGTSRVTECRPTSAHHRSPSSPSRAAHRRCRRSRRNSCHSACRGPSGSEPLRYGRSAPRCPQSDDSPDWSQKTRGQGVRL
jgi:hypothetical protein